MADKRIYELDAAVGIDTAAFFATDSQSAGTKKVSMGDILNATGGKASIKTATLAASATTVTFTQIPTTGTNMFELYTSVPGLEYTSVDDTTSGELTFTFEAQEAAVTVYLVIREVIS